MPEQQNPAKDSQKKKSPDRRRQIWSFLGIVFSFMLLLSLVSYTPADQANGQVRFLDLWKVVTPDEALQAKADRTQNLLGLLGAIISNWFINSTIGYAIIVLPFLGMGWSWYILRKKELHKLVLATNYVVAIALLFSALMGSIRLIGEVPMLSMEWSGTVGDFAANTLYKLIGMVGSFILLLGLLTVVLTLLVDLDIQQSYERLQEWLARVWAWVQKKRSSPKIEVKKEEEYPLPRRTVEIKRDPQEHIPPPPVPKRILTREDKPPVEPPTLHEEEPETSEPEGDLPLDINAPVKEEEVNFDERETPEDVEEEIDYIFPSVELLDVARGSEEVDENELKENAELLRAKLADFGVDIESVSVTPGPVVTLYEIVPATGVKISRIESLQDDIALALKAKGIRIIAPIPGKGTVGVEIPNHNPALVTLRGIINSSRFRDFKGLLPLAMGKTITGEACVDDLAKMPHLLIAGATGSGKSVGINTILTSLIYRLHPSDVKFIIIDPKKIELAQYGKLRNHYLAVSPDIEEEIITTPNNAVLVLKSVEIEMERRYDRLAAAGVRNVADYNERVKSGRLHDTETVKHRKLPYLVIVIDELADLMITAAREVEEPIARLAQLARAVGIHLVLATQRPSVDVITGVIKANFSARIAYQVASKIDSRTILDMNGADQLLGNGDMLYLAAGTPKPVRIQNAFISTDEVERVVNHVSKQKGYSHPTILPSVFEKKKGGGSSGGVSTDELFEEAAKTVVRHQQGSVSLLQRRLKVGYSRAARLIDELEAAGIVGPFDGSKAREVLVETDAELEAILRNL
ncbi:MAG: DNA translocase FtsK 4TM domain-containing protein [Ignavibacteriales bacterium]|nr:DNA translocase FtsK 4TM domain-containing protein [Ignavibacteriales bacterium]